MPCFQLSRLVPFPDKSSFSAILLLAAASSGCWNGDVSNVRLANISLGQQLIDLKRALEQEAISEDEFESAREKLISLYAICETDEEE